MHQPNPERAFEPTSSTRTGNRVEKVIVNDYIEMRQEKVISVAKQLIQKPKQGLCQ
ncbi:hypothetical protein [Caldicellulosiruptor bescii]|uniref:hypothetical protein n=1 Tax=Caldicellulosiruptor bescii TaxID=31899 RepID=UPI0002FFC4A3|nr:hypothetical protein [Caldicellulosiruptor bescii]